MKRETIQACNLIIAHRAKTSPDVVSTIRNKFFLTNVRDPMNLGDGIIALRGFCTSVRNSVVRPLVNINAYVSAFYPSESLLDFMKRYQKKTSTLEYRLKSLRVISSYLKDSNGSPITKVNVIRGFSHRDNRSSFELGNASQIKFRCAEIDSSNDVMVKDYFLQSKFSRKHKNWQKDDYI